jgi:hypothetical protein
MNWSDIRDGFRPWAGIALGTLGFFLAHQIGSDATFQDCRAGSPWIVILGMLVGLAIIGGGAFGSWGVYAAHGEAPSRRLLAIVSLLACALFAIGAILPFIAALIIPGCWA